MRKSIDRRRLTSLGPLNRNISRRAFIGAAGTLTAGAFLASCVPGSSSTPSSTPSSNSGGFKLINFFTTEDDPNTQAVVRAVIDDFESKNAGAKINMVIMGNDERASRVLTGLSVGEDLGIFEVESAYRGAFIDQGYLHPLDELISTIGPDELLTGTRVVKNGHDWVFPYAMQVQVLYGRQDRVPQPPTTFDEFQAAAQKATANGNYGVVLSSGDALAFEYLAFCNFMYTQGADYFDRQGNVTFGSGQVSSAIQNYLAALKYAPPNNSNMAVFDYVTAYTSGRVAMAAWGGRIGPFIAKSKVNDLTWAAPIPWGPAPYHEQRYSYLALDKKTAYPELAIAFLKNLFTGTNGVKYANSVPGGLFPVVKSVREASVAATDVPFLQTQQHRDWFNLQLSLVDKGADTNGPMGQFVNGKLQPYNGAPAPWGAAAYGTHPVDQAMIQHILVDGWSVQQAQQWAVGKYQALVKDYKSKHPGWKPPSA
jgi:multiple sugar transport system substrate-binding protein